MKNIIKLAYSRYVVEADSMYEPDFEFTHIDDPTKNVTRIMTIEEFIDACKNNDKMTSRWMQPVLVDLVVYLNSKIPTFEFLNGASDLKEKYPETFDTILDLMAKCIILTDLEFRQIINFKIE